MEALDLELYKPKFSTPRKQKSGHCNTWLHLLLSRVTMFNLIIRDSFSNYNQYNLVSSLCLLPLQSPLAPSMSCTKLSPSAHFSLAALTTTAWFALRKGHVIKLGCSLPRNWQVCMLTLHFFLAIALGGLTIALSGHSRNKEIVTVTNKGEEHCQF